MRLRVGLALVLFAACGNDKSTIIDPDGHPVGSDGDLGSDGSVMPDAPPGWTPLISRDWSIHAGDTDTYRCVRIQVPSDMWVSGFHAVSPTGTHHMVLTTSSTASPLGDYNCSAGSLDYEMLYAAGIATDDLVFPDGVAIHLTAGMYINLNLHLYDATDNDLAGTSGVMVKTIDAADVTHPADMVFSGTMQIGIPSDGEDHDVTGGCSAPQDWHLFALWPHMHKTAVHQKWTYQPSGGSLTTLLDTDYMFTEQKNYPIAETVVPAGSTITTTCTYNNTTGHPVSFGESSDDEMCFTGMYKYPAGGNLFECVGGF